MPHRVRDWVDAKDISNLDGLRHILRTRQSDGEVSGTELLQNRDGDLIAFRVGDGVVDADEVARLGGFDGFGDVIDDGGGFVVERLAGAEGAAEGVVALRCHSDHVDARCHGELDGEGADGGAGAVDDKGFAALSRRQGRVLQAHEAVGAGAVETCGCGVEGQGKNGGFAVTGAVGNLRGDGGGGGGIELVSTVFGVLGGKAGAVAEDAVSLLEVLHVAADFDNITSYVAAKDDGPLLDEHAAVLDLPVDRVDGDGVVLDNDLVGIGFGVLGICDTEGLALAVKVCCLVGHCDCSGDVVVRMP